jgi:hypothetical protein
MSISEIKVGTIVNVKVGRNIVPAKVIEILEDGFRVSSVAKNKEFVITASRIVVDEEAEPAGVTSDSTESEVAETVEPEEPSAASDSDESEEEFTPSGDDEEDEYVINPAHESDKPVKRLSLLNAAIIVLRETKADMNTRELIEAIVERQLWTPTECKTPEQSLYGSIFREIATKEHPRIVKSEIKGKFRIAD